MFLFLWWLGKRDEHQTVLAEVLSIDSKNESEETVEEFPFTVGLKHAGGGMRAEISRSMAAGLQKGMKKRVTFWRTASGLYRIDDILEAS